MRLIDADELKKKFQERNYWTYTHEYGDAIPIDWIMSGIDNVPTVEKRPPGKWIKITKDGITPAEYTCSNCGRIVKSYYDDWFVVKEYPFCHCGADMRGEE